MSAMEVPEGWKLKKTSDIIEILYGKGLSKENRDESGKFPVYGSNGIVGTHSEYLIDFPSIIIGRKGSVGAINLTPEKFWPTDVTYYVKSIDSKIPLKIIYYLLKYLNLPRLVQSGPKPGLNRNDVYNLHFLFPRSNDTQKKIVAKLDHIFSQLEEKKKEIQKYKEKREQTISQLTQKTIGGIIINYMKLDNAPKDWKIKKFEDCVDVQPGFAQGQKNIKNGTIHLRMNNIGRNFQINYDLVRTINPTKDQLKKYKLEKGDVVFNNTNSPELVGKSFIFNDEKTCLYSNHLTRCRVKKDLILPEWLLFYIRGKWLRRDFERMCNKWINQAAIGGTKLKNLEIPIPSLSEQKEILKHLTNASKQFEEISTLMETIKIRDKENEKLLESIKSSILDSAFSGKLVN